MRIYSYKFMEMAELGKICQRNIFNSQLKRKLIHYSYIKSQYAPFYKNKFRKICIANSGADMSCIHDNLFRKLLPRKIWKFDQWSVPQEIP
jgi:hypothetical protein